MTMPDVEPPANITASALEQAGLQEQQAVELAVYGETLRELAAEMRAFDAEDSAEMSAAWAEVCDGLDCLAAACDAAESARRRLAAGWTRVAGAAMSDSDA